MFYEGWEQTVRNSFQNGVAEWQKPCPQLLFPQAVCKLKKMDAPRQDVVCINSSSRAFNLQSESTYESWMDCYVSKWLLKSDTFLPDCNQKSTCTVDSGFGKVWDGCAYFDVVIPFLFLIHSAYRLSIKFLFVNITTGSLISELSPPHFTDYTLRSVAVVFLTVLARLWME